MTVSILAVPSVTKLPPAADGAVVVGGSHGAVYAAYLSAKAGAGRRSTTMPASAVTRPASAGSPGRETHGMAMAAVVSGSARIGDGADMLTRGVISRANPLAEACGVKPGQSVAEAAELLKAAPWPHPKPAPLTEARTMAGRILCVDSISLATMRDRGKVVVQRQPRRRAGGRNGLGCSGRGWCCSTMPASAWSMRGVRGFAILDRAGIAAATVSTMSARIGDGRSTLLDGFLSRGERGRIPAGRAAGPVGACLGPRRGRKERLSIAAEISRAWPSST